MNVFHEYTKCASSTAMRRMFPPEIRSEKRSDMWIDFPKKFLWGGVDDVVFSISDLSLYIFVLLCRSKKR